MPDNRSPELEEGRIEAALASMSIEEIRLLVQQIEAELSKPYLVHVFQ
jgi:hypothetical protein